MAGEFNAVVADAKLSLEGGEVAGGEIGLWNGDGAGKILLYVPGDGDGCGGFGQRQACGGIGEAGFVEGENSAGGGRWAAGGEGGAESDAGLDFHCGALGGNWRICAGGDLGFHGAI